MPEVNPAFSGDGAHSSSQIDDAVSHLSTQTLAVRRLAIAAPRLPLPPPARFRLARLTAIAPRRLLRSEDPPAVPVRVLKSLLVKMIEVGCEAFLPPPLCRPPSDEALRFAQHTGNLHIFSTS